MAMYVPDNYDAYERYEAEQEMRLSRCPICAYCEEPIQEEYLFKVDGNLDHESCAEELFREKTEFYER